MLDKKKIITLVAVLAALLIAAAIAIVLLVMNLPDSDDQPPATSAPVTQPTSTPTPMETAMHPEPTGTPAATPEGPLGSDSDLDVTAELEEIVRQGAFVASRWRGSASTDARINAYTEAGMSPELAASYVSVWAEVFGEDATAAVDVSVDGEPGIQGIEPLGDTRLLTFAVAIKYRATFHDGSNMRLQQPQEPATWLVTVDEKTGVIVDIEQPAATDLQVDLSE